MGQMEIRRVGSIRPDAWHKGANLLGAILADAALRAVESGDLGLVPWNGGMRIVTLEEAERMASATQPTTE